MNRIALLRKARELSQKELGIAVGVAQNTVCNWENGNREPDHEALKKMASFFDCSIDYLLGRDEEKKEPTPAAGDGPSPLDQRLNELLAAADDKTKQAMVAFLEQFQKP